LVVKWCSDCGDRTVVVGVSLDRVAFLRRRLTIDRQMLLMVGHGPLLAPLKTKASYRTVPLPEVVLESLANHLAHFPAATDGLVFTNEAGNPIRRNRFSDLFRTAVDTAGAPPGTRFHDLRHHCASLLIRHGESVKTVQALLGHASASETLETYAHLWPDSEDPKREAVDQSLGDFQGCASQVPPTNPRAEIPPSCLAPSMSPHVHTTRVDTRRRS
jgi:integrase